MYTQIPHPYPSRSQPFVCLPTASIPRRYISIGSKICRFTSASRDVDDSAPVSVPGRHLIGLHLPPPPFFLPLSYRVYGRKHYGRRATTFFYFLLPNVFDITTIYIYFIVCLTRKLRQSTETEKRGHERTVAQRERR